MNMWGQPLGMNNVLPGPITSMQLSKLWIPRTSEIVFFSYNNEISELQKSFLPPFTLYMFKNLNHGPLLIKIVFNFVGLAIGIFNFALILHNLSKVAISTLWNNTTSLYPSICACKASAKKFPSTCRPVTIVDAFSKGFAAQYMLGSLKWWLSLLT